MTLKIRLRQQGRRNRLSYRLVLADSRFPRDGKYLEMLGWYDPHLTNEKNSVIKADRIQHWIDLGAELSENAHSLVARFAPEVTKKIHARKVAKQIKLNAKRRAVKKKRAAQAK
ncbi:MAG: 30S ribosomal protein S16 [Simkaniaceae bacterium]|nr:30S ribosomal protein S16 [Simkaniaceae bacterium]